MDILAAANPREHRKGFTLVEVILSIVILAVGIISVQRVFIGSLSALSVIENWSQAERLLEEKIWSLDREVREHGKKFNKQKESGLILGSDRTFQYDMSLREISPDARLMEAQSMISWGKRGSGQSIKRTFYLMVPYADWKG
jgi:prepilin-type N-terminal cleavage/methylation domain-containing protein